MIKRDINNVAHKKAIQEGENINTKGNCVTPPHVLAQVFERYESIQTLVDIGADINVEDEQVYILKFYLNGIA